MVSKESRKTYCKICKICKEHMKQVPIRKINSIMIVEQYCPHCDESEILYENFENM